MRSAPLATHSFSFISLASTVKRNPANCNVFRPTILQGCVPAMAIPGRRRETNSPLARPK